MKTLEEELSSRLVEAERLLAECRKNRDIFESLLANAQRRLKELLEKNNGTRLVLTRARDEFVRLGWSSSKGGIIATIDETLKD